MKQKFRKILSLLISLAILATTCTLAVGAEDVSSAETDTSETVSYYVMNGGTGNGTSAETPAPTVYDAVETMIADGNGDGKTVNIYIMQRSDWGTVGKGQSFTGKDDLPTHGMTAWATDGGVVPAHTSQIVVQALDTEGTTYLAYSSKAGQNVTLTLGGPTVFKNITLVSVGQKYLRLETNNYNTVFGEGTAWAYVTNWYGSAGTYNGDESVKSCSALKVTAGISGATKTISEEVTIEYDCKYAPSSGDTNTRLYIDSDGGGTYTYEKDFNLIFNNSEIKPIVHLGNKTKGSSTFKGNLNINIKSADTVTMYDSTATVNSTATVDIKGGYQVIISGSAAYVGDISTFSNVTAEKGAWYMTNNTEFDDFISFTDMAGTYTVKDGYAAMAVDGDGDIIYSENGVLTVPQGEYTVDIARYPVTKDYYVLNGGTGNGTSAETPAASVADVITYMNEVDGLTDIDTANVYIMQRSDWKEASIGKEIGGTDKLAPEHGMTYWAMDGEIDKHAAKVVVQPYDASTTTYLAYNGKLGYAKSMVLGGTTEFKNIVIVSTRNTYQQIFANGNSVTFGEGVIYRYIPKHSGTSTVSTWDGTFSSRNALPTVIGFTNGGTAEKEINVTFENSFSSHSTTQEWIYLDGDGSQAGTYKEDYNLTIDLASSSATPRIYIGNSSGDGTVLEKNLNINVKSPNSLAFMQRSAAFTVNGGLQFILNSQTKLGQAAANAGNNFDTSIRIEEFSNVTVNGGVWYITNKSDYSDLIEFTNTAGTYTVKEGYSALAKDADGNKYYSEDGILTLPAGDYTVNVGRKPITKDYYVINGGTGNGTSAETPAATVADVITYMNEVDGLVEDDTANIYIMQRTDWASIGVGETVAGTGDNAPKHGLTYWSADGTIPDYAAHIILQPYNNEENIHLAYNGQIGLSKAMFLGGPTTFKNLNIVSPRERFLQIYAQGNSVRFGEGVEFLLINRRSSATDTADEIAQPWDGEFGSRGSLPVIIGYNSGTNTVSEKVNVTFESAYTSPGTNNESLYLGGEGTSVNTFEKDVTVTLNNPSLRPRIFLSSNSSGDSGSTTYMGNLNINFIDGGYSANSGVKNVTVADANRPLTVNGGYQVIIADGETYTGDIESFTDVTINGGCWYITNATGNSDLLGFTETAGVYTVNSDSNYVYAYSEDSDTIYYGTDTLTIKEAGSWTVKAVNSLDEIDYEPITAGFISWIDNGDGTMTAEYVKEGEALAQYSDYINYRGNLTNTHTKLTTGDKSLNVVYFGGSVTNGTGASDRDSTSWRALIGNWISANFPEAEVTNVNRAVGESGTYLGSYRVGRDVIAENPDLLFIEYSINDYYWDASYEQAALQYETIVRNVREALPECDIVTVLVTDSSQAKHARNGTLHTQAQAHEDMAATYGISTIHVGRALADSLPEDWTYDEDWLVYMTDTVHPNDTGYKKYYQVIREFMYNSLIYSENDGTVTEYELIELQSDSLLDGNITVIEASEELLARSEELGGSGFEYNSGSTSMHTYYGDIRANTEGAEFVLEMTGTELAAYISKSGTISQFYVKVDDGEYELKDISNKNPTIIFEGLVSKEHTIYIKPVITADTTGRIAFPVFYSRDAAYQTTKYVHYGDTNADGEINIKDLVNAKKKMVNLDEYCPPVDIDKDGAMASGDLVMLRKHIIKSEIIVWEDEN